MKRLIIMSLVICLSAGVANAAMRKGPYLLYPGVNDEMMVLWQLDTTQACTLEWGEDTTYSSGSVQTAEFGGDHQHEYVITNLTPGVKYYYRVTESVSHTGSFTAAPADVDVGNVKILAYGDTRTNPGSQDQVTDDMITAYTADPDYQTMIMLSGDWVNSNSEADWDNQFFDRSYSNNLEFQANVPINGCIGNHEGSGSVYEKYYPYPYVGGFYWSFDYGPVHIAVIDQYHSGGYAPSSAQHTWLEDDLATTTKEWKIILLHEPGWSAGGGHGNRADVQNYIQPLCLTYGVDLVMCGHNHYYSRCLVDGVHHITAGGGGAPLRTPESGYPYLVESEQTLHFCKIDVQGYDLTFEVIRVPENTLLETFTINHTVPNPPDPATSPNPANGATDISVFADITWNAGALAESHDVYFGTNATPGAGEFQGNQTGTTYDPGNLTASTTYYWRIDEVNPVGITTGTVWSYTTQAPTYPGAPSAPDPADGITDVSLTGMISWTAGTLTDDYDVYFGTNPTPTDWLGNTSNTTIDPGTLSPLTTYYWQVVANNYFGSTAGPIWEFTTMPPDTAPPTPNPASFVSAPAAISTSAISMTATTGSDVSSPVEYLFTEVSGNPGGDSSTWQTSSSYTDTGLSEATQYTYAVTMRDSVGNTGTMSISENATTNSAPPMPNPASFASAPEGLSVTAMTMTATTGSDDTGPVEYYFAEVSGNPGGSDSGWVTSPVYIDTGLLETTEYTYTVQMRDALLNYGNVSSAVSGTTLSSEVLLEQNDNQNDKMDVKDGLMGAQSFSHGSGSDPDYEISKVELKLSRESDSPNSDLEFSIGTSTNGGTISGSMFNITPSSVTNTSGGDSFMTYTITFSTPVGPLSANTTYYLNFETGGNGKAYFLGYNDDSDYGDGSYYKDGSDDNKDSYFKIFGSDIGPADIDPPTPNPATFVSAPSADSETAISMTATTGSDVSGPVEYYFDETSGNPGGTDSGWQTSANYTDSGLTAYTQYTYTVQMRDSLSNTGTASSPANATTDAETDPPTPNPATFAVAPAADSDTAISMTATTGSDASGPVEYFFNETSGNPGGSDSGWQTSASYTDSGLTAETQYTYTVQMRDSAAPTPNAGTASSPANTTTDATPDTTAPTPNPAT
ncbi:MAG: metallophosphoesterase [Planctomycetota bacterium]